MAFQGRDRRAQQTFDSPEQMYLLAGLPRTTAAAQSLWTHQGRVLQAYADDHQKTSDLALELPTGTGKTLVGLLIAEWVRRKGEGSVLYATPTQQLAKQVKATAEAEGVPAHLLVGKAADWNFTSELEVGNGEAIGITTYNSVFNTNPKVPSSRLIIFDDAHAGEQFVGNNYAVAIRRYQQQAAYETVVNALKPFLSGIHLQRLLGAEAPGFHHQVRLIVPAVNPDAMAALDTALATLDDHRFQLAMIRQSLEACLVYLSYGAIEIRPMVAPTFANRVFAGAEQRIYLSATLGVGGDLERAFGRANITRLAIDEKSPPRSGRRLFVFPDVTTGGDGMAVTKTIVARTNKAIVLSQTSVEQALSNAAELAPSGVPALGKADIEHGLDAFIKAPSGVLGLANRYDGMDLPHDACRVVVLAGRPDMVSLQERFLSERAEASAALAERVRTRVVQGAGRATRGPNDYAVVVALGSDITKYLSSPDTVQALEPELQAELAFGWQNSKSVDPSAILENVDTFLAHDVDWREGGEPHLADYREESTKTEPAGAAALGAAAPFEVEAWELAGSGKWSTAGQKLEEAARLVGGGGDSTRGYRALLLYIAGVWAHLGSDSEAQRARARELIRNAEKAAVRGTWLREMADLPETGDRELGAADASAVAAIAARLAGHLKAAKITSDLEEMCDDLNATAATTYEPALTVLGDYLGAEAFKPPDKGRCDSAWCWDNHQWLAVEAKSEQQPDGLLSLAYIRQANTQLDHLAEDRGLDHVPAGSASVIVSPRVAVDPKDAVVANDSVFLTTPDTVSQVGADVKAAWGDLLTSSNRSGSVQSLRKQVHSVLTQYGCLPSQVADRLTVERIRP